MPRVRRVRKRRRAKDLNDFQVDYLREGLALLCEKWAADTEIVQTDWEAIRDRLIDEFPFHRPWAWWKFDAPEGLRVRQPGDTPASLAAAIHAKFNEDYRHTYSKETLQHSDFRLDYESEAEYLIRLDLLTDREKELLAEIEGASNGRQ